MPQDQPYSTSEQLASLEQPGAQKEKTTLELIQERSEGKRKQRKVEEHSSDLVNSFGLMDLPEEPRVDATQLEVERNKVIQEHQKKFRAKKGNFESIKRVPYEDVKTELDEAKNNLSEYGKQDRAKAVDDLTKHSFESAEQLIQLLEFLTFSDKKGDRDLRSLYSSYTDHWIKYAQERNSGVLQTLKILDKHPEALTQENVSRLVKLIYNPSNLNRYRWDTIAYYLINLSEVPKDKFEHLWNLMETEYPFLIPGSSLDDGSDKKIEFILKLLQRGELNTDELETLNILSRMSGIAGSIVHSHPLFKSKDPEIIFQNKERLKDELRVIEQVIYEYELKGNESHIEAISNDFECYSHHLFAKLDQLSKKELLHPLVSLLDKNWKIDKYLGSFYSNYGRYAHIGEEFVREVWKRTNPDKIFGEDLDDETKELAEFLTNIIKITENKRDLTDHEINDIKSLLNPDNRIVLKELISLADKLGDDPAEKRNLFVQFYSVNDNNSYAYDGRRHRLRDRPNFGNLNRILWSADRDQKLDKHNDKFWIFLANVRPVDIKKESRNNYMIVNILLRNKNNFSSLVETYEGTYRDYNGKLAEGLLGNFKIDFLKEGLKYLSSLPNDISANSITAENVFFFNLLLSPSCPTVLKPLSAPYRQLIDSGNTKGYFRINSFFKENIDSFITNNAANWSLLVNYLLEHRQLEAVHRLVVEEKIISTLPPSDKTFWQNWNTFPESIKELFYENPDLAIEGEREVALEIFKRFNNKAESILTGYSQCVKQGIINHQNKALLFEFLDEVKICTPEVLKGYLEALKLGTKEVFITHFKSLVEKIIRGGITESERKSAYYNSLIKMVYPNNIGNFASHEEVTKCGDRESDLEGFRIKPRYEIDLLKVGDIKIKEGEALNKKVADESIAPIKKVIDVINSLGSDREATKNHFEAKLDASIEKIKEKGGLENISNINTKEERIFLILADTLYGSGAIDANTLRELLVSYEFTYLENGNNYLSQLQQKMRTAKNGDYALLCELNEFFSDRIKEVIRVVVQSSSQNSEISLLMTEYFKSLSAKRQRKGYQEKINRLQIDKLGESESFRKQIVRLLERRSGKKYTDQQISRLIHLYEVTAGGLREKSSTSSNPLTKAVYGQLRTQREKTIQAAKEIGGVEIDPRNIHLGEINLEQYLETEVEITEGVYDPESFFSYTAQKAIDLFADDITKIQTELDKFVSESGNKREVVYGYITKSKESAFARMVGGVCVAGDNKMWSMPNYFQLVFQDPDSYRCLGLVLLHHFTEDGKKILTASLNPSSTYLYSVDEEAFIKGIMGALEDFAIENEFDLITFSQNKGIRTNRTGGKFEQAMDQRIKEVDKTYSFSTMQQFSYFPSYRLRDMDIAWERPTV